VTRPIEDEAALWTTTPLHRMTGCDGLARACTGAHARRCLGLLPPLYTVCALGYPRALTFREHAVLPRVHISCNWAYEYLLPRIN